ncbi:MAG: phosphatidylinositol-3-phosphate phosphatase [Aeromicrobium sp.]|jgi:hypothetical protein|nr:phosphatidylinositol-3-phosphate phosphatase [Aeromicrobium sp.]
MPRFVVAALALAVVLGGAVALAVTFKPDDAASPAQAHPSRPTATDAPTHPTTPTPRPGPTGGAKVVDKVMVIVLENHSAAQIQAEAPRLTALADTYGVAPHAVAPCDHPSLPNYVCLSSGAKLLTSDRMQTLSQPDVWNNTLDAGRSMKVYAEGLPAAVDDRFDESGKYVPRHVFTVPFVATAAKRANFARFTVNARTLSADVARGDLPNVGALIPDQCHNAHDECPEVAATQIKQADDWIADRVRLLQSGPDWKAGHLLIVVTADEDNKEGINDIPMIAIHPSLSHLSTGVAVDLFSVGGLLADVGHTPRLGKQATSPSFADAFQLSVPAH